VGHWCGFTNIAEW